MIVNFKEIKDLLQNGNLADIVRETGLPRRTLENYKYKTNDAFENMENTLTTLQNYINEERNKMNIKEKIEETLNDLDEEIRNEMWDVYLTENGDIWLTSRGMAYSGDDKVELVAYVDEQEIDLV